MHKLFHVIKNIMENGFEFYYACLKFEIPYISVCVCVCV